MIGLIPYPQFTKKAAFEQNVVTKFQPFCDLDFSSNATNADTAKQATSQPQDKPQGWLNKFIKWLIDYIRFFS